MDWLVVATLAIVNYYSGKTLACNHAHLEHLLIIVNVVVAIQHAQLAKMLQLVLLVRLAS
jgi:hypothetical protein